MLRWIAFPVLCAAIALAAWWGLARWTLILWVPLLVVALYDAVQRRHTLRRNYPLIAHIRWLFEALRPFLYAYVVESPFDGRPSPAASATSSMRAPRAISTRIPSAPSSTSIRTNMNG